MQILKDFKEFAMKGNVVDLAVGIIIGGAFGKIVSSLVADVLMPPIGLLLGGMDFSGFAITLKSAQGGAPAVLIKYGTFLNTLIDFLIVAWALFMIIHVMNRLKRKQAAVAATAVPTRQEMLLAEIRDLLKNRR